ncbi:MAG: TlpA family protein disulfide reductase [Firmicutes bacterium]|nr:TlpA family protein disulfide reductase [Bacillota bacterium]
MNKIRMIVFLLIVMISAALLFGCTAPPQEQAEGGNKEDIPEGMMDLAMEDFEAVDFEGNTVKLSDYKGKIIFLSFWATWCPPCREEMPWMQEIYDEHKDQDVVILAVSPTSVEMRGGDDSDRAENQVRKFITENGYTFPVLLDKEDKAWSVYQQRGIPANYVIDKQGIIRYTIPGAFRSKEQMETFIENIRSIE